jgi:hypothetical protein
VPIAPFAWTHDKTRVEFDGDALTINDKRLPLDRIERLARELSSSTAQGSWNRLTANVLLLADGEVSSVKFRGDASQEDWGPWRPLWDELDTLVRHEIQPRLLDRTVRQVSDTGLAEICPFTAKGRGRLIITAENLKQRKLFAKPIAWESITDVSGEFVRITYLDPSGKQRTHDTGYGAAEWDAWQVAHLWRHYGSS